PAVYGRVVSHLRRVTRQACIGVFFFASRRRHTISYGDWSSDVCSSDLSGDHEIARVDWGYSNPISYSTPWFAVPRLGFIVLALRSEERRVGKECRSRWSQDR